MLHTSSMASSSTSPRITYQVFLSFRGDDIRKSFIDHLYTALDDAGIRTFKDDEELEKGENIESELQTAILESRVAIVVLSENYASSRWCLNELVKILECKKTTGLNVLPVFYQVEPSQVRHQRGSFAAGLLKHEDGWMDKVAGWKAALREVADLGGMDLQDGYESKFIKKIVKVVEDKLKRTALNLPPSLIGIGYRIRNINKWLQDGSSEVGILTIYGIGGIGKTTIAKLGYNLNYRRFEASSFLENARETLEQSDGLLRLHKKLLSDILKGENVKICSPDEGINKIRDVISCKRVLLVIDDVDQKNKLKLEPLLGMHHLFYPGSKIILTTRHKQLLKGHKVYKEYEIQKLDVNESLELFSCHAFGQDHPLEGYFEQSKRVVNYCGGLPLALHVLGRSLYGENMDLWKSTLEKLEEIPNIEILEILAVSYDSIQDEHDKNLFLDIACFFIGEDKSHLVTILDKCGFYTIVGVQNLINRTLLTIDKNNKLMMHQLLRDMGREKVRQESPKKPGKRSRLWHHNDSFKVLKENTGTETIEGLVLNMDILKEDNSSIRSFNSYNENDTDLKTDTFKRMHSLRILQINNVQLTGGYKEFPKNLRFLCWRGLPSSYVPRDFPLENLVAIDMCNSKLEQLWEGTKVLRHVKILNLSHCHDLTKSPVFSQLPSLERLILEDCVSLIEVHESIVEVEGLILLNLKGCKSLRKLPRNIGILKDLETLIISGCSNLEELPTNLRGMESLKVFYADGVTLSTLQSTTEEDTSWRAFIWSWLSKPRKVPVLSWESFPCSIVSLSLSGCNLSDDAFPGDFGNMPSLQNINLSGNPICFLPDCIKGFTRLNSLELSSCNQLQTLIGLPRIDELALISCTLLEKLTFQTPWCHSSVAHLDGCEKLVDMEGIFKLVPTEKIDAEMINYLGLYDLESMKRIEMTFRNCYTRSTYKGPIQGVYEYGGGIFSIFLPGCSKVPDWFTYKKSGKSLSFTVPSSPLNRMIGGLILCTVYAYNGKRWDIETNIITILYNDTKDMRLDFYPACYALPATGDDIIWLSHWNFGSQQLEAGDEMHVEVYSENSSKLPVFEIKELGIHFVYKEQDQTINKTHSNSQEVGFWYESWTSD